MDITSRVAEVCGLPQSRTLPSVKFLSWRAIPLWVRVKQARDPNYQAIMPIRGKILNCLKADYDKIFKSEIITDLIKVLGCGVEVKSKANKDLVLVRPERAALEQDHPLHRCRRGRLPDPHAAADDAVPADAARSSKKAQGVHCGIAAVMKSRRRTRRILRTTSMKRTSFLTQLGGQKLHDPALERSGRKRPGHDEPDDDEPGNAPADSGAARRCRQ